MLINSFKLIAAIPGLCFLAAASFAQASREPCKLKVDVFASEENAVIKDSAITLTRLADNQTVKPWIMQATFDGTTSGKYKIEITKEGYAQRVKEFDLDCRFTNEDGLFTESVYLLTQEEQKIPRPTKGGRVVNGRALFITKPMYPAALRGSQKISREVTVELLIDEDGNILSADAVNENSLLGKAAEKAARLSKFQPTRWNGFPVKVLGSISFNFVP